MDGLVFVLVACVAILAVMAGRLIPTAARGYLRWVRVVRRTCRWEGCPMEAVAGSHFCSDEHAQAEHERLRWDLYP